MEVQEEAYEKYPYPCIRAFHYVNLMMCENPIYPTVLAAGKAGNALFLDLGCCMGSDVRKLAYDGYPARNIFGCDLRPEYIDAGYKLYRDRATCAIRFFTSNVFDVPMSFIPPSVPSVPVSEITDLKQLTGALSHVYAGALFHLFDEGTQYAIALRLAVLLRREKGAIVFGRHSGLVQEGMIDDHLGRTRYGHSPASWTRMWKRVFAEAEGAEFAETRVVVKAELAARGVPYDLSRRRGESMLVWSVQVV